MVLSLLFCASTAEQGVKKRRQMLPLKSDVCRRPLRMCRNACECERLFFFFFSYFFLFHFLFYWESASIYKSTQSHFFKKRKRSRGAHWWDLNVNTVPPTWWHNKLDEGCRRNTSALPASRCSVFQGVIAHPVRLQLCCNNSNGKKERKIRAVYVFSQKYYKIIIHTYNSFDFNTVGSFDGGARS